MSKIRFLSSICRLAASSLVAVVGAFYVAASTAEPLEAIDGVGIGRGITRIVCRFEDSDVYLRSRAIIVYTGDANPRREVMLAPAHGLPGDTERILENCSVVGFRGSRLEITRIWIAQDRDVPLVGDWAVLVTERAVSGEVVRRPVHLLNQTLEDVSSGSENVVRLMLHSQSVDQDCTLYFDNSQRSTRLDPELFSHSCPTWRGVSGAPIVVGVNSEPVVIGFHIAALQRPPVRSGAPIKGIGRAVDAGIVLAIDEAAAHARSRSGR